MNVEVILLDIEGTIAPIAYVQDVLFPFARERLGEFLDAHWDAPPVVEIRRQISVDAGGTAFDQADLLRHLFGLMNADAKATGLKALQGLIWERGYRSGQLRSRLFPDVPEALRRWHERGLTTAIYSSGSAAAQRVFIAHTEFGDLTPYVAAHFDTTSGPKHALRSYVNVARTLERVPQQILFISDVVAELDAAAAAGMQTRLSIRPGNPPQPENSHTAIETLATVILAAPA